MVVEPESLCWLTGRLVKARDGVTWAEEFARFPSLVAVVRDDGSGLGKGVKLERARRLAAGRTDLDDSLDVFHTLREGARALRTTWGAAARATFVSVHFFPGIGVRESVSVLFVTARPGTGEWRSW
jgi:hypothetical protein